MKRRQGVAFLAQITLSLVLVVGIYSLSTLSSLSQSPSEITISAAISLSDALKEIKPLYEKSQTQTKITYNFGSSGSLQQQIEQGAPVDIFISAAAKQMDALEAKNLLLNGTRKNLLTNKIVLITPKNSTGISSFQDLTKPQIKRIALGEPKSVPAGQYAQETLKFYNLLRQVEAKLIFAKDVRQVLTYVESGNVDAGLVYLTDAKTSSDIKVVATAPNNAHAPIVYPIAVIKDSQQKNPAKDVVKFLSSNPAKAVFSKYGFGLAK